VSSDSLSSDAPNEAISRVSDQGFIGESEATSGGVIGELAVGDCRSSRWEATVEVS
jgi:hypothetical protein